MSLSADSDGEESQNYEHDRDLQPLAWHNIEFDENKMEKLIVEIGNNTDNLPQIIEAAKGVLDISGGINAIMIPLYPLAR